MDNANPLLRDGPGLLESAWAYRWLVLAAAVVGGALVYGLASIQPEVYEAQAKMFLGVPNEDTVTGQVFNVDENQRIGQLAARLNTDKVYVDAAESQNIRAGITELRERIDVIGTPENATITVVTRGGTPQTASGLANALVTTHLDEVERVNTVEEERVVAQFDAEIAALQQQVEDVERQLRAGDDVVAPVRLQSLLDQIAQQQQRKTTFLIDNAAFGNGVREVEFAQPPSSPVAPQPKRMAAVGVVMGGALGVALAFWLAGRATRVETEDKPAALLRAPLLGSLRKLPSPDRAVDARDDEAYRFILSSIESVLSRRGGSSVLVTTAAPTNGKTEFALWLAVSAARDGREVVLVDGDVRDRRLTRVVSSHFRKGKVKLNGLTDIAAGKRSVDEAVFNYPVSQNTAFLSIVTAGRATDDTNTFVRSPGFREAMNAIRDYAELTLVDAAPLLSVADTSAIAGHVDGLVVLVHRGASQKELESLRNRLQFVAAPLLGYVFVEDERDESQVPPAPLRRLAPSAEEGEGRRPALLGGGRSRVES